MKIRLVMAGLALAALLTACTDVVNGSGTSGVSGGPTISGSPTPCPHVAYPAARLAFDCITTGLTAAYHGEVWPVQEYKIVEPATGWVLETGAGHWGSPNGQSLEDIALNVRQQMVDAGGYGGHPTMVTDANRATTVDGATAREVQTTFSINPAWARSDGTKVKQEKLWIVAIEVGAGDVSLWYTSVPDLAKSLWPTVPSAIATIRVG
jgi:hypothetical protein